MPVAGEEHQFTKQNVDNAPQKPGVYVLLNQNGGVLYYGMSQTSIRSRLQSHLSGKEGAGTKSAAKYKREVTTAAAAPAREEALLAAYKKKNGKLPPYNEKAS